MKSELDVALLMRAMEDGLRGYLELEPLMMRSLRLLQ